VKRACTTVRRERGVAFVLVLWVIAMLSILLGSFALVARTENLQSRHLFDTTKARYAAEAGLNLAVYELRKSDPTQRWIGDGRPYRFMFDDVQVEVSLTDDSGKIDINTAQPDLLIGMFMTAGAEQETATRLAAAVQDWRDPDDLAQPDGAEESDYKSAGLSYGPANAPFNTVSELQQVLGMDYALYEKIAPAVTIYSGRGTPSSGYASAEVLQAMHPDWSPEEIRQLVTERQAQQPGTGETPLLGPDGQPIVAGGGGLTYSVKSRATLSNGASTVLDTTIRLGGVNAAGRPYVILRWRDDDSA
jgi:general secretion pathway protein K